ncbi:MAG: tyrosine--tRNA ligase [Actinomycetota bacterium]
MGTPSIDEQVDAIFLGAEFGDEQLAQAMEKELRERLALGRPLRVYVGYDPTSPDLHLGHTITMRKLKLFQDFGHDVTFLVGTFTAQVGDVSDKLEGRPRLAPERVRDAAASYAAQAFKILDPAKTTVAYNDEWLAVLELADVIELASAFTVQQFLARDTFRKRMDRGDPLRLHEFLYALLQGYDALHLKADVQMGATEQLFNILAGRRLQELYGQPPSIAITFPVLVGTDGTARMAKSAGNYVGIAERPIEQYGKVMSIDDDAMRQWIPLVTSWSPTEVREKLAALDAHVLHPMELKKHLASDVVRTYHGAEAAATAQEHFEALHQRRDHDDAAEPLRIESPVLLDVLTGLGSSKREAGRLLEQGAVRVNGDAVTDAAHELRTGDVLKVGKRQVFRIEQ